MKNLFINLILIYITLPAFSQSVLQGSIKDAETGEKMPGVEIYIPAIKIGAVSDIDGNYKIKNIPNGKFNVIFSFIGYENQIKTINFNDSIYSYNTSLKPSAIKTQEVIVSGGGYLSQHQNAIKIESLNAKAIEQENSLSLIKTMAKLPGVDAISKGNGIATPVVRGLSTSNILVLTDGFRMENFQFSINHPFMISDAGVDHIEFIKGPASLLYGSDAIGGAINLISEKPAPANTVKADLSAKYNTNTQGINSNLGVKFSKEHFFGGVRVNFDQNKDYISGNGQKVANSRFNQKSINAFTGYNTSNGSFKIYYKHNQMNLGLPQAEDTYSQDNKYKLTSFYQNLSNDMIYTRNSLFFNRLKIELNASYQFNNRRLYTKPNTKNYKAVEMHLNTYQYEVKSDYDFNENNTMIFAFQGMNQNNTNVNAPTHVLPDFSLNDASLFGLFIHKNKKFSSQAGIRYSYRNINIPNLEPNINDTATTSLSRNYNNISFSVGGTYRINNNILLRANMASAFRSPNVAELSQNGAHDNRYEKGDINLTSQRNYEADLSSHFHFDKWAFNIGGFYNYINNYIYLAPTTVDSMKIYQYMQSNSVLTGIETSFDLAITKQINFEQSYSYIYAVKDNGEYLPLIPQNKIKGSLSYKFKKSKYWSNLKFKISNEIAFAKKDIAASETPTDAYNVFGAGLFFTKIVDFGQLDFNLSVHNIFDEVYYDHLSTLKDMGYYNIGRNISISFKYTF